MALPTHLGRAVAQSEAAYAAGFFDGEGSVVLSCCFDRLDGGLRNRYDLRASLAQKDNRPLLWLRDRFGGTVTSYTSKYNHRAGSCNMWQWRVGVTQTIAFLKSVRPFLIVKATQADLAFAFVETIGHGRSGVPDDVVNERKRIFQAMKDAKRDYGLNQAAA